MCIESNRTEVVRVVRVAGCVPIVIIGVKGRVDDRISSAAPRWRCLFHFFSVLEPVHRAGEYRMAPRYKTHTAQWHVEQYLPATISMQNLPISLCGITWPMIRSTLRRIATYCCGESGYLSDVGSAFDISNQKLILIESVDPPPRRYID